MRTRPGILSVLPASTGGATMPAIPSAVIRDDEANMAHGRKVIRDFAHIGGADRGMVTAVTDAALTPREAEVAALVAQGLTNRAIARELGVAENTVKVHLHAAFKKLGVASRRALSMQTRGGG